MSVLAAAVSVSTPLLTRHPGGGLPAGSSANGRLGSFNAVTRVVSHDPHRRLSCPRASLEYMFDTNRPGSIFASASPPADVAASPAGPAAVPLERLEAQICELAGHLAAATTAPILIPIQV
jgi:hypothetical protein